MKITLKNCRLRDSDKFGVGIKDLYLAMILESLEALQDPKTTSNLYQKEIDWLFNDRFGQVSLKQACENANISIKLVRKIALLAIGESST